MAKVSQLGGLEEHDHVEVPAELEGVDYTVDAETEGYREMLMLAGETGVIRIGDFALDAEGQFDAESIKLARKAFEEMQDASAEMTEIVERASREGLTYNDRVRFRNAGMAVAVGVGTLMPLAAMAEGTTGIEFVDKGIAYGDAFTEAVGDLASMTIETMSTLIYTTTFLVEYGLMVWGLAGLAHYGYVGGRGGARLLKHKLAMRGDLEAQESSVPHILRQGGYVVDGLVAEKGRKNKKVVANGTSIEDTLFGLSGDLASGKVYSVELLERIDNPRLRRALSALVSHYQGRNVLEPAQLQTYSTTLRRELKNLKANPVAVKGVPAQILLPLMVFITLLIGGVGYINGKMKYNEYLERAKAEHIHGSSGDNKEVEVVPTVEAPPTFDDGDDVDPTIE